MIGKNALALDDARTGKNTICIVEAQPLPGQTWPIEPAAGAAVIGQRQQDNGDPPKLDFAGTLDFTA
jgi:hypothetical protein